MDQDLQQQVQKRLAELPADVQAAIRSAEVATKIQEIGKRNNLHIDQVGKLEDEVYIIMLGFADPQGFMEDLADVLGLAPEAAAKLATEITNEIFMPIRASMQAWTEEQIAKQDADLVSEALAPEAPKASNSSNSSVMMPSSSKPVGTTVSAPGMTPAPAPAAVVPAAPLSAAPVLGAADAILSEKKVAPPPAASASAAPTTPATSPIAKNDPAQPQNYKADPYREPVE